MGIESVGKCFKWFVCIIMEIIDFFIDWDVFFIKGYVGGSVCFGYSLFIFYLSDLILLEVCINCLLDVWMCYFILIRVFLLI